MQAGEAALRFEPPLPRWKADAIGAVGNGLFNKVALRWRPEEVFWPKEAHMLGFNLPLRRDSRPGPDAWRVEEVGADAQEESLLRSRHNMWVVNYLPLDGQPMLVAMMTAALAVEMQAMDDGAVVERVLAALRRMYAKVPEPAASIVSRWDRDEFARGSYSFLKQGWRGAADFEALMAPVGGACAADAASEQGCVLFAGQRHTEGLPPPRIRPTAKWRLQRGSAVRGRRCFFRLL